MTRRRLRTFFVQRGHVFYRRHLKGTRLGRMIGQQILKRGLVSSNELQISALRSDRLATHDTEYADALQAEADFGVPGFHLSPPLNLCLSDMLTVRPHINVLLPSLRLKHMSGGPNTALLLAALLAERGEHLRLICCDCSAEGEEAALFPHMDALLKRPVARERIQLVDAFDRTHSIEIGAYDLFLATAWWTAQIAKYAVEKTVHKTFIYLVQDFEPILHEGSTFQARALETYGLPHIPLINSRLLLDHLVRQGSGCYADPRFVENAFWFEPALDRGYYFPDSKSDGQSGKRVLLFYARPSVARRNLFELGVVALRRAVASGVIDKENWEVWAMGETLAPVALGNSVFLNPLPWMSFEQYAKRVRTADLLLSLMLSPHPSYPPLEMAASGNLVVTNSFSVKTAERMQAISPNIIVAEPTSESIAAALENAAGRINARLPTYDPSGSVALPSDWDASLSEIVPLLIERIHALRTSTPESRSPFVPGLPSTPRTKYEAYRRARLARRRREGGYYQEAGLLSFVTSAYNTDPQFLEALASSVFLQDGGMHFEWVILDNGSTDENTRRALLQIARQPGVVLERVEQNLGIIGGMRFLLKRARGRYVLPLDSDDLIERDCVNVLTRFIKDHDFPPLLYSDEDKLGEGRFGSPYFKPDWDPVLFLHSCYIAHLCAIDRAKAIELGLYTDKGAEGCHDWDSFIRFMNAGYKPLHVPEVLYSWRIHSESTSGNIASKSYISESHRNTLQRYLSQSGVPNIELVNSPLFNYGVDWWFRRKHVDPPPIQSIVIGPRERLRNAAIGAAETQLSLMLDPRANIADLAALVERIDVELIHISWYGVVPDDDEWRWDACGLLELFGDVVMVGGVLHDGIKILDGPRVFGFGSGLDCPDANRSLADPGYGARMWKPHAVSAVSSAHCILRVSFLRRCMAELLAHAVPIDVLGPWLGALALEAGDRVVYSPFMRARTSASLVGLPPPNAIANFLSRFWSLVPDLRVYSPRMGLELASAYVAVDPQVNKLHCSRLQAQLLPYSDWLTMRLRRRSVLYPVAEDQVRITLITTVYEGTNMGLLGVLADSVYGQTTKAAQWIVVAHGPISLENLDYISRLGTDLARPIVVVEPQPLGIMGAMRRGLETAVGEYIVPVDADDVLTLDAVQILAHSIARFDRPDLVFSDEDLLVNGQPASPYLRSRFDPVLNLDSSYVWHICAINRERAIGLGLYTDPGATWCHDWDSVMRVTNAGGRIEHVPEVLYHWRKHTGSTTNNSQGDPRSLDSTRYVLERQIAATADPRHYYVAQWPEDCRVRELYIARRPEDLPEFVWIGDALTPEVKHGNDAILVIVTSGVLIDSQNVLVEVARLFELHPRVGAVGGLVQNKQGMVVDACYMLNDCNMLESPWLGRPVDYVGPYALAQKPQTVSTTGASLAFYRVRALEQAGQWPLKATSSASSLAMKLCGEISGKNWTIAFSPLVRAHVSSAFRANLPSARPPSGVPRTITSGLVRYGTARSFSG